MVGYFTSGAFLSILHILLYLIFTKIDEVEMISIVILWIEKFKHIEVYEPIKIGLYNNKWS